MVAVPWAQPGECRELSPDPKCQRSLPMVHWPELTTWAQPTWQGWGARAERNIQTPLVAQEKENINTTEWPLPLPIIECSPRCVTAELLSARSLPETEVRLVPGFQLSPWFYPGHLECPPPRRSVKV